MNRIIKIMLVTFAAATTSVISASAQEAATDVSNQWSVRAGINLSHICADAMAWDYSAMKPSYEPASFGWGVGAMVGASYDIRFNRFWSLAPGLEIQYINNGGKIHSGYYSTANDFHHQHANVRHSWDVLIPVLMNMRAPVSENVGIRVGAGPYVSESFVVKAYSPFNDKLEDYGGDFGHYFDFGLMGELAVETGRHFSYFYRLQYPMLKNHIHHRTLTMSLGVSYAF